MLHGLERPDGPVELHPLLGVGDGEVEGRLSRADAVDHESDEHAVDHFGDRVGGVTRAHAPGRRPVEDDGGMRARAVNCGCGLHPQTAGPSIHGEEGEGVAVSGGDQQDVGRLCVGNEGLGAGEGVTAGPGAHAAPVAAVVFEEGDGRRRRAVGEAGEEVVAVVGCNEGRRGRHGRGEEGTRVDGAAELLEHDADVDHPHARPAVPLGDEEAGQPELGEALPDGVSRATCVTEQVAHVGLDGRLLGEEAADGGPKRLLLI